MNDPILAQLAASIEAGELTLEELEPVLVAHIERRLAEWERTIAALDEARKRRPRTRRGRLLGTSDYLLDEIDAILAEEGE